jgi:hypothetical protein
MGGGLLKLKTLKVGSHRIENLRSRFPLLLRKFSSVLSGVFLASAAVRCLHTTILSRYPSADQGCKI